MRAAHSTTSCCILTRVHRVTARAFEKTQTHAPLSSCRACMPRARASARSASVRPRPNLWMPYSLTMLTDPTATCSHRPCPPARGDNNQGVSVLSTRDASRLTARLFAWLYCPGPGVDRALASSIASGIFAVLFFDHAESADLQCGPRPLVPGRGGQFSSGNCVNMMAPESSVVPGGAFCGAEIDVTPF